MRVMVGMDEKEKITGIRIIEQYETPGLGDGIIEESFILQFRNRTSSEVKLKKDKGSIEAVTGATISSKACVDAVRKGVMYIEQQKQEQ